MAPVGASPMTCALKIYTCLLLLHCGCMAPPGTGWTNPIDPAAERVIPPFAIPHAEPGVAYQRFFVIGDMGTGKPGQYRVARAMAQRAEREPIDFILTVGDNIYPDGVRSVDDPQWQAKFENVYDDPVLNVPIYPTLGNHDYHADPQAQVEYSELSDRWTMPDRYYTFTRNLDDEMVDFFAIDTTPIAKNTESADSQLAWLKRALADSTARWKIVYGHHVLYSHSRHGDNPTMIDALEPIFTAHDIDLYVAGHDHSLEMLKPIRGVHYVVSGAAGGEEKAYAVNWTDESYYAATVGGFIACRISDDELVIEFVRPNGETQYAHTLTKQND